MKKENLHQPFEISVKELEESPLKEHEHTFFELVYILSGTGLQCINNNKFDYHEGHMFLITPQDCHSFDIHTTTKFFFIRFNDIYIHSGFFGTKNIKNLEFILQHANHQPGCILKNITDKPLIKSIIEALIREYVNQDLYNKELIQQLINTLIVIVTRNIAKYLPEKIDERSEEKTLDILQYIQNNIYNPDKIKADTISQHFGISQNYLGRYFKKHTATRTAVCPFPRRDRRKSGGRSQSAPTSYPCPTSRNTPAPACGAAPARSRR